MKSKASRVLSLLTLRIPLNGWFLHCFECSLKEKVIAVFDPLKAQDEQESDEKTFWQIMPFG